MEYINTNDKNIVKLIYSTCKNNFSEEDLLCLDFNPTYRNKIIVNNIYNIDNDYVIEFINISNIIIKTDLVKSEDIKHIKVGYIFICLNVDTYKNDEDILVITGYFVCK